MINPGRGEKKKKGGVADPQSLKKNSSNVPSNECYPGLEILSLLGEGGEGKKGGRRSVNKRGEEAPV